MAREITEEELNRALKKRDLEHAKRQLKRTEDEEVLILTRLAYWRQQIAELEA